MITVEERFCTTTNYGDFTDIYPRELGWDKCAPHQSWGPSTRTYYLIHYVTKGKGKFTSPRGTYDVSAGQIFIIRAHESTSYAPIAQDPWSYIWVGFSGKLAENLKKCPDVMNFDQPELFEMCMKYPGLKQMKAEFLIGCFSLILAAACSSYADNKMIETGYVSHISEFIELNYMNYLSVEALANSINISRRYLSNLFKENYGLTLKEYITDVRLRHACEFLKKGYNVTKTANMCGYTDVFNFSKMFRKKMNISPQEYKNKRKAECE